MHFFYFNGYRPVTIQGGICVQKERKIKYGRYKTVHIVHAKRNIALFVHIEQGI